MLDRRAVLRGLATLPLVGGAVALISRQPAVAAPDPLARARLAWDEFAAAMRDLTADADGWVILGAGERVTPLPNLPASSFVRVAATHYQTEHDPRLPKPFTTERHREIALDPVEGARLREREARGEVRL